MGIELTEDQIFACMKLEHWWDSDSNQLFNLSGQAGSGKAQPIDTIIPTPNGNIKLGDLQLGDYVFNRHGDPVKVIGIYEQGELEAFKVTFDDDRSTICNDEHLWTIVNNDGSESTKTLRDIRLSSKKTKIHVQEAVKYSEKNFNLKVSDIIDIINNGSIPEEYFYGSIAERSLILMGLFDTTTKSNQKIFRCPLHKYSLITDTERLMSSLGYLYEETKDDKYYYLYMRNDKYTYITDIKDLGYKVTMRCIVVDDPESLYLTNDFIVTHNSTIIRHFIERINLPYKNVIFCAFSGKAAARLAKEGLSAKTIHSAIYNYVELYDRDEHGRIKFKENGKPKKIHKFELKEKLGKNIKLIVVDEAGMVPENIAKDLMSFDVPIVAIGDRCQLNPIFGKPYFLDNPDVHMTQVMRQKEGDPIIYLANEILKGHRLQYGVYGKSAVIRKSDLSMFQFRDADIVLTATNRLRQSINNMYREEIKKFKSLDMLHIGEKVICRKNNWSKSIGGIYLTNGTSGFVDDIDRSSLTKNGTMEMDFRPDYTKKVYRNLIFDYNHMFNIEKEDDNSAYRKKLINIFEFGYAITVHLSQGETFNKVLFLNDNFFNDPEDRKRLDYTAITRASDSIIIVQ